MPVWLNLNAHSFVTTPAVDVDDAADVCFAPDNGSPLGLEDDLGVDAPRLPLPRTRLAQDSSTSSSPASGE